MAFRVTFNILQFAIFSQAVFSQAIYFNMRYDFYNKWEVAWSVIELDNGYFSVGGVGDSLTGDNTIGFLFLNKDGTIKWGKTLNIEGEEYVGASGSLTSTIDNNFAFGGSVSDSFGYSDALLVKIDSIADTLWTKKFALGNSTVDDIFYQCKQTPDSGFILIGVTNYGGNDNILLIKTNSLGNLQWQKTYGGGGVEYGFYVEVTNDSGYLLSGYTEFGSNGGYDAYIIKTKSDGTVQWSKTYGGSFDDCAPAIEMTSDSNFVLAYCSGTKEIGTSGYFANITRITKIDSNGNIIWDKDFGPSRYATGPEIIHELTDKSFVVGGQIFLEDGVISGNIAGYILKISSTGDSIWFRYYDYYPCSSSGDSYLRDLKPTADDGFIAAGFYQVATSCGDTGSQDMWIFKTDSCGCLQPNCNPPPVAAFAYTATDSTIVTFTNQSAGAYAYLWDFGDGATFFTYESRTSEKNPVHTYTDTGVYLVTLVAITCGARDTIQDSVILKITGAQLLADKECHFKIFPNPARNQITIEYQFNQSNEANVEFFDLLGIKHDYSLTGQNGKKIINVKQWNSGMYYYVIIVNNNTIDRKKLVILK